MADNKVSRNPVGEVVKFFIENCCFLHDLIKISLGRQILNLPCV